MAAGDTHAVLKTKLAEFMNNVCGRVRARALVCVCVCVRALPFDICRGFVTSKMM